MNGAFDHNFINAEIALLKKSFFQFFQEAWQVINPFVPLEINWTHKLICDELQKEIERWLRRELKTKDIIINIPPRSLKSIIVNQMFPAWVWTIAPHFSFISGSCVDSLTIKNSTECRKIIESPWYKIRFGDTCQITKGDNLKGRYGNTKSGTRISCTTRGAIIGEGANCFIYDDCLDKRRAMSDKYRNDCIEWYTGTTRTRLNDQRYDFRVIIEQRLHEHDLTGYCTTQEPTRWRQIKIPAYRRDAPDDTRHFYEGETYDIRRATPDVLESFRATMTPYDYSCQYDQSPRPQGGNMITGEWFDKIEYKDFIKAIGKTKYTPHFFADTAYTTNTQNAANVILCGYYHKRILYIVSVFRDWLEIDDFLEQAKDFIHTHGTSKSMFYVEPKATGKSVVQSLRRNTNINVVEGLAPITDKIAATNANVPFIASKRVKLVNGTWIPDFVSECELFPNVSHKDQVDTLNHAINHYWTDRDEGYKHKKVILPKAR